MTPSDYRYIFLVMARGKGTFLMANRLTDGRLVEIVERYRRLGLSWAAISRVISADYGVEVSGETLRVWIEEQKFSEAAS